MKHIYWMNDSNDMIYELSVSDTIEGADGREGYIVYNAELVCGREYPTDNYGIDALRWCSPDYFVDDVKYTSVVQYFETESLEQAVADTEGWHKIDKLPSPIYEWVVE